MGGSAAGGEGRAVPASAADAGADAFEAERAHLLGLAYRLLGSWAESEDVVQDAWLRWSAADRASIANPAAWLSTATSRLALDRLRSAQHRRESYVGPWLPEPQVRPVGAAMAPDPAEHAELAESLALGFLTVLEELKPVERVVFVLADVYDVPYTEIAVLVGKAPEACRQIASRARRRVREGRPRLDAASGAQAVVAQLLAALAAGDVAGVASLLADDVVLLSDGGPNRHAARHPVVGAHRVSRLVVNLARRYADASIELVEVNGQAGLVLRTPAGAPIMVTELEVVDGRIWRVHSVLAPEKLALLPLPPA